MCGLGGIFHFSGAGPAVERATLERLGDATRHRGPDGFGTWMSPEGRLGLVHNRLAIVDLAPAAAQPMSNEAGTVTVVFNGEIYNHRPLRRELEAAGQRFRTDHADTEVIVQGFEAWGREACSSACAGCSPSRCGTRAAPPAPRARPRRHQAALPAALGRPARLRLRDQGASCACPACRARWTRARCTTTSAGWCAPAPMTLFAGIQKLPPGTSLTVPLDGAPSVRRYWRMADPAGPVPATPEAASDEVRGILYDALDEHCMADVPIGVFLSGGVDSGALLARLSSVVPGRVRTFSVGYEGIRDLDERDRAREMAERFGAEHREVVVGLDTLEASWRRSSTTRTSRSPTGCASRSGTWRSSRPRT